MDDVVDASLFDNVTNTSLSGVEICGKSVIQRKNCFMGIDIEQIQANYSTLKNIRIQITDEESVKPYASLEFRIHCPPTNALKEIVDPNYPVRMLTKDKQCYLNLSGKKCSFLI